MDFLSKELIASEYPDRLRRDLERATLCRFLVAYVSQAGLDTLGTNALLHALRDPRSFGVASLSCSCGYEPLLGLQGKLADSRLKYFMDPIVKPPDDPDITLFHSKLVYLVFEAERKAVVYIGSHNWTSPALGPVGPRNAEASLRFKLDFVPEHLDGIGS